MNFRFLIYLPFLLISFAGKADSTEVSGIRDFVISEKNIEVTILLKNTGSGGFATLTEYFPEGFSISKVQCEKGHAKIQNSILKVVWDDFPDEEPIKIKYLLKINDPVNDTFSLLNGVFNAEFLPISEPEIRIKNGAKIYRNKPADILVSSVKENENYSYSGSPDEGIYICVQVAALSKLPDKAKIKKSYGYSGGFDVHYEDNLYRVTIGRFKSVSEAEAVMKELRTAFFAKCFLSAYKNGHKISVNEAEALLK